MSKGFWISRVLIDNVLPEPRTGLESWNRWQNNLQAQLVGHMGRKIEVVVL